MTGIADFNIYIPRYRVRRDLIASAWGKPPIPGSKAVCNFDEDTLTMAYSTVFPVMRSGPGPDRILFASTSAPYWQRSSASQIAAACDLAPQTATADFGGSLRCGVSALIAGLEAVQAGNAQHVFITAADRRDAAPESAEELSFSDAAVCFSVAREGVFAELIATVSRSDDFIDEWRRDRDVFVQGYPSKYTTSRGFEANVSSVIKAVLAKANIDGAQLARAAIPCPGGAPVAVCAKSLGIPPERLVDVSEFGLTGAAMPLIVLAQACAQSSPGDLILCVGYGDGADALLFRITAPAPSVTPDPHSIEYSTYPLFRKSRAYLRESSGAAEISNVQSKHEEPQNIRLHGTKCRVCGTVAFPITRICGACRNNEGLLEVPLARTGQVFTFTKDFLYDAPVQPTIMAVLDLDGGGRFLCQMTDVDHRDVRIGMPVELILRRMREGPSNHHYYWKCRPV